VKQSKDKIALFAFRNSRKRFFEKIVAECPHENFNIIVSKKCYALSFKGWDKLKNAHLQSAYDFAVAEFYAKTNLKIPLFLVQSYFKLFSMLNFLRYYAALDHGYNKMLVWNGGKFRQQIALEVAKIQKIKVYFFENGLLPNTMVFDDKGININNSVPREKSFFKNYHASTELPTQLVPRVGKDKEIFKGQKETLPSSYIFVPFQVDYDTQIISHSKWVKNMRMLFDVIEKISQESAYHFVFKEHPSSGISYEDLYARIKEMPNLHFRNTYSTQELIEKSEAVITINSTVGLESLLFHKKVIVLGDAFYTIDGIAFSAKNQQELIEKIEKIKTLSLDHEAVDHFLKYLYHEYLVQKNNTIHKTICQKIRAK